MQISADVLNLLALVPRAAIVIDTQASYVPYCNPAAERIFGIHSGCDGAELLAIMPYLPASNVWLNKITQELQSETKSVFRHFEMKTTAAEIEYYDVHISYVDESQTAVYLLFTPSDHKLSKMQQQNTYYSSISQATYAYSFHLDIKARRAEFFDSTIETVDHLPLVMENFPEPVLRSTHLCESDHFDYLQVVERMYRGEPAQGSFRFYSPKGELLRYTPSYIVTRDANGAPIAVDGDFVIQTEVKIDTDKPTQTADATQKTALPHQIKPHFFFNTLNTISALCKQDANTADEAIVTFANYMRSYMHLINERELVPFAQELSLVKSTLALETLRFPGLFQYELDIAETDFLVPALSIQPIVENALLHGLRRTGCHGTLKISTTRTGDAIQVTIADNGLGFNTSILSKPSKASSLQTLTQRIQQLVNGTVSYQSGRGKGTTVTIDFPCLS